MNNKIGILQSVAIVVGALLILLFSSAYIVYQPEQAIVLQFGEPIRVINEAGLKFKVPFVQNVVFYDLRLLNLDPPAQEVVLNDKKRLDVDSFTRYRIINPLQFYQTVRTEEQARSKLAEIVNSSLRKVLGRVTLTELLSQQRTQIMDDISAIVKKDAEAIGVSVADVRIRRADLPREVMQAINDRMKTERQRDAKEFRAKGQQQAQNIRATADKEATIIVAEAEKNAQIKRGEGDKQAVELWNKIVGQDVDFYDFYRSLYAYKKSLSNDETSLVLSPDSDFFKYFNKSLTA
ncbi:MAG: protease modulator HflC [Alphaproteobacteria bacterium]|nr:protease modulator HflC [Alphaproteobacteria bacterium]